MDHYVRGIGETFEWRQVLETLAEEDVATQPVSDGFARRDVEDPTTRR
jgi:hypothetical protein